MLIENYKGVEIWHNANKDEFYTNVVISEGANSKKDEVITSPRLQKTRNGIDKFLNTAAKKPVLKKVWLKGKYDSDNYELVEVILYNSISDTVITKDSSGRQYNTTLKNNDWRSNNRLFLHCKENDIIIAGLVKKQDEINKIKKELSCSSGKLLPLKIVHLK